MVPRPGVSPDRLVAALERWALDTLAPEERPVRFDVGDALPRNELGKLADWSRAANRLAIGRVGDGGRCRMQSANGRVERGKKVRKVFLHRFRQACEPACGDILGEWFRLPRKPRDGIVDDVDLRQC